ncbi:unnamed protein product [Gongylonema pulchrum]|uniref:Uncharacterized protein n=1 Tax=Gongylonema pulchrum TaxID=637853 RepID=A0A183DR47_9BILA|nr:unnamed protein product [Gongylonema pulchrum]
MASARSSTKIYVKGEEQLRFALRPVDSTAPQTIHPSDDERLEMLATVKQQRQQYWRRSRRNSSNEVCCPEQADQHKFTLSSTLTNATNALPLDNRHFFIRHASINLVSLITGCEIISNTAQHFCSQTAIRYIVF